MKPNSINTLRVSKLPAGVARFLLNLTLLFFILSVPSGMTAWFNGLPWSGQAETVLMMVLIPALLMAGWRFLFLKGVSIVLLILLTAKLALAFSNTSDGWKIKIFPSEKDYDRGVWIETYDTLWQSDLSGLLLRPWSDKRDFPLEWAGNLMSQDIWVKRFQAAPTQMIPGSPPQYDDIRPVVEVSGSVQFHEPSELIIEAEGAVQSSIQLTSSTGEQIPVKLFDTERAQDPSNREKLVGRWNVSGTLVYFGENWTLKPYVVTGHNVVNPAFDGNTLFRADIDHLSSPSVVYLFRQLSNGFDLSLAAFIVVWIIWLYRYLIKRNVLTWLLISLSFSGVLLPFVFSEVLDALIIGRGVNLGGAPLGLTLLLCGAGLFAAVALRPSVKQMVEGNISLVVFLLFAPAMFAFYVIQWWSGLDRVPALSSHDDWSNYQDFAFQIAVWGEILSGGEGVFRFQPFYRYLVAILHWLFGRSFVSQQLFDVWCVLGAAVILASIARRFSVSSQSALLASILYIVPVLMSPIRHHIGRGLTEHTAMLFLMLAAWLLSHPDRKHSFRIWLAGVISVLGYWTRQDHLLVLTVLVCLWIEPINGTAAKAWTTFRTRFLGQWKPISVYLLIVISGVVALTVRNWILAGQFELGIPDILTHRDGTPLPIAAQLKYFFQKSYLILTMKFIGQAPSPFAIVMLLGTLFGLVALFWRPTLLQTIPISVGLLLSASLIPYYFFDFYAYGARFSIHVLPIATISMIFVLDRLLKSSDDKNKLQG